VYKVLQGCPVTDVENNAAVEAVVVVDIVVKKGFTGAYRALQKKIGGLRVRIYSGSNCGKVGGLFKI